ncbi:MAG: AAA family ATPase, partial [Desulfovibrionaceae bacterium]
MLDLVFQPTVSFTLASFQFVGFPEQTPPGSIPGTAELTIPFHSLKQNPDPLALLSWKSWGRLFAGRQEELARLHQWAESEGGPSMCFVCGPGGVGKTRLAAQFGQELRARGWAAGVVSLSGGEDRRDRPPYRLGGAGTLLIIDYPEEKPSAVEDLFRALAGLEEDVRLRVLFLTRSDYSAWRDRAVDHGVTDLVHDDPLALAPWGVGRDDVETAQTIVNGVQETLCGLKKYQHLSAPHPLSPEQMQAWMTMAPTHCYALFLVALGIYTVLFPEEPALSFTGPEIISALVDRELRRLRNASKGMGLPGDALPRLLAAATIAGGLGWGRLRDDGADLLGLIGAPGGWDGHGPLREAGWLKDVEIKGTEAQGETVTHTDPDILAPIIPDIVGAAFVHQVLEAFDRHAG